MTSTARTDANFVSVQVERDGDQCRASVPTALHPHPESTASFGALLALANAAYGG